MCSNHSISNRSGGYPFSHPEVSGLPCLVTLMRALQALGRRNLPISEWVCWGTSALFLLPYKHSCVKIWTLNMMMWEFLWLSQVPDVMRRSDKSFSTKLSHWVWVKLYYIIYIPLQRLFTMTRFKYSVLNGSLTNVICTHAVQDNSVSIMWLLLLAFCI